MKRIQVTWSGVKKAASFATIRQAITSFPAKKPQNHKWTNDTVESVVSVQSGFSIVHIFTFISFIKSSTKWLDTTVSD